VRKGDDLANFIVSKIMKNPEALTFRVPRGLFRPVAGKLKKKKNLYTAVDRQWLYVGD
jgi:hypothetical protein